MGRGTLLRVWLPMLLGLYALIAVFRFGPGPSDGIRWFGLFLGLIGLSGVVVARYTLGVSFSIAPKARELVTTGIYSHVRNPIYASGMVMLAGVFLMMRIGWLWLLLLPLLIVQIIRVRQEARVLEAKFGAAYRNYRARTWF